jgi:methyl-accepting chemotaxis protein
MKKEQHRKIEEDHAYHLITSTQGISEKMSPGSKTQARLVQGVLNSGRTPENIAAAIDELAHRANRVALMAAVASQRVGVAEMELAMLAREAREMAVLSAETVKATRQQIAYAIRLSKRINHAVTTLTSESFTGKRAVR